MNKKLINIILIVAVLGFAGFLFLSNTKESSQITLSPTPEISSSPVAYPIGETVSPTPESTTPTVTPTSTQTPPPVGGSTPTPIITVHTITYTTTGYSPNTITVKAGDTVTFKNNSSNNMWPASNPHPTHTNYPGFDAKGPISSGGQWSFKFSTVGTWGYHDHLNTIKTGIITVQ